MKKQILQYFIFLMALAVFVANANTRNIAFEGKKTQNIHQNKSKKEQSSYQKVSIEATINLAQSQIQSFFCNAYIYIYDIIILKSLFCYTYFFRNYFLEILFSRLMPANAP